MDDKGWLISIGSAITVALLGGMKILWDRINTKEGEHKEERKEWAKMAEDMMKRQNEVIQSISERHDEALKELSEKYDKRQGEINDTMLAAFKQIFGRQK